MSAAERYRALLDERSATLATRGRGATRAAERRDFLVCAVGAELYGLSLTVTAAVLPEGLCTRVPGSPQALRGIVAQAGVIVSVIDFAEAMGIVREREERQERESGHFLRLRADDPPVALAVDRVVGLASIEIDAIEPPPAAETRDGFGAGAISGYAPAGSDRSGAVRGGFAIVDLPRLLRPFLP